MQKLSHWQTIKLPRTCVQRRHAMTDDAMVYWSMLATGSQFESKNVLQSANKILLLHPDVFIYTVVHLFAKLHVKQVMVVKWQNQNLTCASTRGRF
jgi:hypothetical protein